MRKPLLALFALLLCAAPMGSCSKTPETPANSKAYRVTSRTQLIGGPTALGDIGDYMLENGEIRLLVQDKTFNRGAGVFGGSLIDADLARATNVGGPIGGNGNDSFGEMFPAFFLEMIDPDALEVVNDGSNGEAAIVEVRGRGGEFITMIRYLNQLLLSAYKNPSTVVQDLTSGRPPDSDSAPNLEFTTRYILEPGARHVRIESTMRNIGPLRIDFPPPDVVRALQFVIPDVELGNFRLPTGHVLGFGKLSEIFLPGLGYDIELGLRDAGAEPVQLPAFPGFLTPLVGSTNENGVNYGFMTDLDPDTNFVYQRDQENLYGGRAAPDDMLYLFNASGFGGVFTNQAPASLVSSHCGEGLDPEAVCDAAFPDEMQRNTQCKSQWDRCLADRAELDDSFTYVNYLIIGDGDVASLWEEFYRIRGQEVQQVRGRVIDGATGSPAGVKESVLFYQNDGDDCADGTIYSQVYTIEGGRFQLDLPPGDYCARSQAHGRPLGDFVEFTVPESSGVNVELTAKGRGRVVARVASEDGVPLPAKMTIVGVHDYYGTPDPNYRGILMDQVAGEPHRPTDLVPDEENDPMTRRYIEDMAYGGADGVVELDVRPGKYTVYLSRGLEYDIVARDVDVKPGGTVRVGATLKRLLDTSGHISGDFHMHQAGSIDSGLDYNKRVISVAGEGVELVVSTEHNYISDLEPYVYRNNLQTWVKSVVGIELTTFESGHFNGFPVERTLESMNRGSFAWQDIPPDRIFAQMRDMAPEGEDMIIQVNHPRTPILGYFEQHNVDPFDATVTLPINVAGAGITDTLITPNGPQFIEPVEVEGRTEYRTTFSFDFDAIEIFNGPHLEELRHFRMPFDKNAPAGEPDALPESTREGLRTTMVTEAEDNLNALLAEFLTERDGAEVTEEQVEMLSDAEREAAIDDWVQAAIPEQWAILCDGNGIVHPGGLDDWYNLLNYPRSDGEYVKFTATGNSDSHSAHLDPPGLPRNFFFVGHDDPERVSQADLVEALRKHHNIVSNGPFVDFTVDGGKMGSEVTASGSVEVKVTIRSVPWIGADRFRIVANGEVARGVDPAQSEDYWGWVPIELDANGEFEGTYNVDVDRDTWFVIEVESDTSMFPVIEPQDIPPFNFSDVIGGLAGAFGFGAGVEGLEPNFVFPLTGFAFTNPIWVVTDGDGEFTPPSPPVFRCQDGVYGPADADPNALLDLEEIRRVTEGRLRASTLPKGVHEPPSPLKRPTGENRDLRIIFEAWGHAH